jgi:Interleukin-like EMT inducer
VNRLRRHAPDLLALGLLIILPLLVFWQVWTPNSADRVMFGGDILMGAYPTRVYIHRLMEMGQLPLWNPYQLGGMPLIGDIQAAPFYLPNLTLGWLSRGHDISFLGFELLVIAHYALGGAGLYLYLRGLRMGWAAALVGAVAFEFNGFFIGHRGHYNMLAVAAWLPWVLALLDQAWGARSARLSLAWAAVAGLAASQLVMAGHPQAALYCGTLGAAYVAWRWALSLQALRAAGAAPASTGWRDTLQRAGQIMRVPGIALIAGAIGVGTALVALLPAFELLGRSLRNEPTYSFAIQYSLLPRNLVTLLMPELLGWSGTEYRIYAGVVTLVLAGVAVAVPGKARPERSFFAAASVVALVVAMGGFTSLQGIVYRFLPGFTSVRVSVRAFYIANLALAVLAAYGTEVLIRKLEVVELRRLQRLVRALWATLGAVAVGGAAIYFLIIQSYRPTGEDFFFAESLFRRSPASDTYELMTQVGNQYAFFGVLLLAATILLWLRASDRLTSGRFATAALLIVALDVTSFAPYHDTIKADPDKVSFTVRSYASTILSTWWEQQDQQQLIDRVAQVPDGTRVDNAAEVLPDNYSQMWRTSFSSGYNVLDIKERFELLTQWPNLSDTTRRDLLGVGYIMTLPPKPDAEGKTPPAQPPEPDAKLILSNSQGSLWQRAQQPAYARFATQIRPAGPSIATNAFLSIPDAGAGAQPTLDSDTLKQPLRSLLSERWPALSDPAWYAIGSTGVSSPVDIGVLAGGPIKYSAILVDGKLVTPERRGIVMALIDPKSGKVLSADGYDTYQLESESDRLAVTIETAPASTIVALAIYDEGTNRLTDRARAALASVGAQEQLRDAFGKSYALIGVKGTAAGSAVERIGDTPLTLDVGLGAMPAAPAEFSYQIMRYEQSQITLQVSNSAYGVLTLSESAYPGWSAYVDGVETPVLRANGMQRAVVLAPTLDGKPHEVTLIYAPKSYQTGAALSLLMLSLTIGALAAIAVSYLPRRAPLPAPSPA